MICTDGCGWYRAHAADGWLVSPEGRPVQPMCVLHAGAVISEYREKLGEDWRFAADRGRAA